MKRKFFRKCTAILCAVTMLTSAIPFTAVAETGENLVTNSTFDSGTASWGTYFTDGGECSLSTDNGRLALNINSVGTLSYSVQMFYDVVPLYKGGVYRVKYDISCTTDRFVEGMIQQNGGTYQAYTWQGLDLTSEPQTVDYEFTMEKDTDIMARLVFNCGIQNGEDLEPHTIYLDNVSVELVDDSNADTSGNDVYEPPIVTNQLGYRTNAIKTAVFENADNETSFSVVNADTNEIVYTGELSDAVDCTFSGESNRTGDFSAVTTPGSYYITCGELDKSYTFEISDSVYNEALDASVKMLYLQRCGCEVEDDTFGHSTCHTSLATVYGTNEKIDVSGGWHDAGDYGRYVVPAAKTVADLFYAYQTAPQLYGDDTGIPESGNGVPDILDEIRYALEWMQKMQAESGGVYHKVSCANFPGYVMPEKETDELIVTPVSTTATADFCGSMAVGYELFMEYDKDFAESCLAAAENAWTFLEANPNLIFTNPSDIVTGSYGDSSDKDERYWAAAQMWRATGEEKYLTAVDSIGVKTGMDTANFGDYGNVAILTMKDVDTSLTVYQNAKNSILKSAKDHLSDSQNNPFAFSVTQHYRNGWGSNMKAGSQGVLMAYAYQLTGDNAYLDAANGNLNYLFGCNPLGISYFTGFGTVFPEHPHHRPSIAMGECMPGMLVGGVHPYLEDSAALAYCDGKPTGKCYVDNQESYSTNEITTYWNSPLTYLLSFTETLGAESVRGDVNADGALTVADVVALQKWLLAVPDVKLADWKAGDLCVDDRLDVFDLCIMKRELLNQ